VPYTYGGGIESHWEISSNMLGRSNCKVSFVVPDDILDVDVTITVLHKDDK
jgi:hypothetical protein